MKTVGDVINELPDTTEGVLEVLRQYPNVDAYDHARDACCPLALHINLAVDVPELLVHTHRVIAYRRDGAERFALPPHVTRAIAVLDGEAWQEGER